MNKIVFILIIFFISLITYQIITTHFTRPIIEGLDNNQDNNQDNSQDNNQDNDQDNSEDISDLKTQMDTMTATMRDISGNLANIQSQVNGLAEAQKQTGEDLVGTTTPTVTGTS